MSTRCLIKIEGNTHAKIYKHFDGYPSAMLPWLEEFNSDFEKNGSGDRCYKFAQLLRSSVVDADKFDLDKSKYNGWSVVDYYEKCSLCEFVYLLREDGSVSYRQLNGW